MREIFTEIFENQPVDPIEAARQAARPRLRKRFYKSVHTGDGDESGVAILLDGKPVLTPSRRMLTASTRALAQAIAEEWDAQTDVIDPARMPLTRLANAVIDAVSEATQAVADEITRYLASDLLFYRAEAPLATDISTAYRPRSFADQALPPAASASSDSRSSGSETSASPSPAMGHCSCGRSQ